MVCYVVVLGVFCCEVPAALLVTEGVLTEYQMVSSEQIERLVWRSAVRGYGALRYCGSRMVWIRGRWESESATAL